MTALLTSNLPLLAGAPNGIMKLRELILELAVRGKLLEQNDDDEPASELLKQITEEKQLVIAKGKAREQISLQEIDEAAAPFKAAPGWLWIKLGDISLIERGGSPRPIKDFLTEDADGLNWIKIGDTDKGGKYITSAGEKIRREGLVKTRMVYPGDFLLTNSMSFGRPYITQIEGCIHDGWLRISPPASLVKDYLYLLLSSPYVRSFFVQAAAGAVVLNLNADKVRELPIPLPPLPEQHRIVAKVDELMALCDRLEARQADAENAHAQLVQALLDSLTQAHDAEDFAQSWQRLAEHFHTLFTTESSIDALKQTLLQLAVMGKLVPQDPSDEPASELLKRISEKRAAGVAGRRSPKQTALSSIGPDEKSFELPSNWEWVRLQQIISVSSGDGLVSTRMKPEGGIPVYGGNGITGYHDQKNVETETLVIGRVGYYCGSIHLTPAQAWVTDNALIVSFSEENIYKEFLYWLLKGTNLKEQENATAQPVISGRKIYPIVLAIPPLAEQHRIVAKVDQVMALCDQLKARLNQARQAHEQLANALVEQAVA